jgi:hypothetical protein
MKAPERGNGAMKRIMLIVLAIAGLLLFPAAGYPQASQDTTAAAPPVAPPLVREGAFALSLVNALNIGSALDEADAESLLASVGIAPRNGWVADYPVTPDVLGDLQAAVAAACDSHRLAMGKEEALKSLQGVADEFGLPILVGGPGSSAPPYSPESPTAVDNYYYAYGPPVVTYYAPPPYYGYLYAWVPYPFWFGGFFFTGFYCLHDFDRVIMVNHVARVCTNHVFDRRTGTIAVIDPAHHQFAEPGRVSRGLTGTSPGLSTPREHFQAQVPSERQFHSGSMTRSEGAGSGGGSFTQPREGALSGSRNEFHGSAISRGQPFGVVHSEGINHGRSFAGYHGGGFTHDSGSFEGYHGGGFSHGSSFGGYHGGGFSHGGSFGGFHGGGFGHGGRR